MLKRKTFFILIFVFLWLGNFVNVSAQEQQLILKLSRDWGYGGFNNDIEGLFSMKVTGPPELSSVDFFIDDTKIGQVSQTPYNFQFTTDNYPLGLHKLSATGYSINGIEYRSNVIEVDFVPKQSAMKFILPILGIILLAILISVLLAMMGNRGNKKSIPLGAERNYGAGGGGICGNCQRPFSLSLFSLNLGASKLAKCPYCGKWGLIKIEPINKLRQAEMEELENRGSAPRIIEADDDQLKREIDDSKYQDL